MCSSKSVSPQLVSEDIMAITQATSHITEIVSTKFEEAKRVIDGFEMTLDISQREVEEFMKDVAESLERFKTSLRECLALLKEERRRRRSTEAIEILEEHVQPVMGVDVEHSAMELLVEDIARSMECSVVELALIETPIYREHVEYVSKKDGAGLEDLEPLTDLLKKTGDDLANVKKTTSDRFDLFFKSLRLVENRFENIIKGNENKRREITKTISVLFKSLEEGEGLQNPFKPYWVT